jgi:hypothetical protein
MKVRTGEPATSPWKAKLDEVRISGSDDVVQGRNHNELENSISVTGSVSALRRGQRDTLFGPVDGADTINCLTVI